MASVTGKLGCSRPIMVDHFAYLKSVARRMPKFTMPSPGSAHFRGGRNAISRTVYPELEEFWADLGAAYRKAIGHLYDAGCRYVQLDDVGFSYLCDEKVRENFRKNGDNPDDLPRAYAQAINAALEDRPADLGVTMHTCRGNFRSTWFAAGGYQDAVVEAMFSASVDGFFMEWDSERAGGFGPLRLLPKGKKVVLGLVTTKSGTLESKDALKRRIDEAARIVPLENLCLSPQCGFASTHHGNKLRKRAMAQARADRRGCRRSMAKRVLVTIRSALVRPGTEIAGWTGRSDAVFESTISFGVSSHSTIGMNCWRSVADAANSISNTPTPVSAADTYTSESAMRARSGRLSEFRKRSSG
jgi:methionine synthase II (cobalamin-independent)